MGADLNGTLKQCAVQHDRQAASASGASALTSSPAAWVDRQRRSVDHAKNSVVEGEHEKRDDKAHAGQCNCDLNHPASIDYNFLMPGELL